MDLEYICCFIYIICVITIMIENYTMGPNSTSLFILTLRKLQTIRQQGNTLPAVAFNFGSPTSSHRRTGDVWKTCVTKCA